MRPATIPSLCAILTVAACASESDDPAEGGFFNGIRGVTSGTYDARVAEREQAVETARESNRSLAAEQGEIAERLAATKGALARARLTLLQQRDAASGLDAGTRQRVDSVLRAQASAGSDAQQLEDLQRILAETRALSRELAQLSG